MSRGQPSGISLGKSDVRIVLGMDARGDRNHDIAAWFGVNQGRIAEAKNGEYGSLEAAPANELPPQGPPGLKGRRLRQQIQIALDALTVGGDDSSQKAHDLIVDAIKKYDANER